MAILTFSTAILILLFFPETQYTRNTAVENIKRTWADDLSFAPVSGGGKPKEHR
jgi:hypothetical protein